MKLLIAVPAMMMLCAAPAFAQVTQPPADGAGAIFKALDTNADSSLSLAEVQKADASVEKADFDRYDADKSAALSLDEFNAWHSDMEDAEKHSGTH
jgi:hypothetical protein